MNTTTTKSISHEVLVLKNIISNEKNEKKYI